MFLIYIRGQRVEQLTKGLRSIVRYAVVRWEGAIAKTHLLGAKPPD